MARLSECAHLEGKSVMEGDADPEGTAGATLTLTLGVRTSDGSTSVCVDIVACVDVRDRVLVELADPRWMTVRVCVDIAVPLLEPDKLPLSGCEGLSVALAVRVPLCEEALLKVID